MLWRDELCPVINCAISRYKQSFPHQPLIVYYQETPNFKAHCYLLNVNNTDYC